MSDSNTEVEPAALIEETAEEVKTPTPAVEKPLEKRNWAHQRIDEITAQKWEATRLADKLAVEKAAIQARVQELEAKLRGDDFEPDTSTTSGLTAKEVEELAEAKAHQLVAEREFTARCNEIFDLGKEAFDDFEVVLGNYKDVGGMPTEFVEAVMEVDKKFQHRVIYDLARDQDEAYRVMRLPPKRMVAELIKRSLKYERPAIDRPVSEAPEPIPVTRGSGPSTEEKDPAKMTTAQWMRHREKEIEAKNKR